MREIVKDFIGWLFVFAVVFSLWIGFDVLTLYTAGDFTWRP